MMTNLEYYKDEINGLIKELNQGSVCCAIKDVFEVFSKRHLSNYANRPDKFVDWLLSEHKEPIKLKKWEHDLIKIDFSLFKDHYFKASIICMELKKAGYFKGIKDTNMIVEEILNNCEVEDE